MLNNRDLKAIYQLLGEVRALGADPVRWPTHALEGLRKLFKGSHGSGAMVGLPRPNSDEVPTVELQLAVGLKDEQEHLRLHRMLHSGEVAGGPYFARMIRHPALFTTVCRHDILPDDEWYGAPLPKTHYQDFGADHFVHSQLISPKIGKLTSIIIYRALGEPRYGQRERRMLRLFHAELARMWMTDLAVPIEENVRSLSPRQRQVLWHLCTGDGEKQVAEKLSISPHTVHDYVKALHNHFEVSSRSELLAKVMRGTDRQFGELAIPDAGHYAVLDDDSLSIH